ncbi:MAG: ABC transporter permease [Erysipelotrichaceae bacterium]
MLPLIKFSLQRRFLNKTTLLWNLMLFLLIGGMGFADHLVNALFPQLQEKTNVAVDDASFLAYLQQLEPSMTFVAQLESLGPKDVRLDVQEGTLTFPYQKQSDIALLLNAHYAQYQSLMLVQEQIHDPLVWEHYLTPAQLESVVEEPVGDPDEGALSFMVLTAIYFVMLSFSTSIANEVIYEKATKTLELILTSVSAKVHLLSKMIVGWTTLFFQGGLSVLYGVVWLLLRNQFDQGVGLLDWMRGFHVMEVPFSTISEGLAMLYQPKALFGFFNAFIILFAGMLIVQLTLTLVSSFITSLEEASAIQAPFYLVLLGIYYGCLAFTDAYALHFGMGRTLSMVPVFSMLLLPCRLLFGSVPWWEVLVSVGGTLTCLVLLYRVGVPLYAQGVLDYANRGLKWRHIVHALRPVKRT